MKMNWCRLWHDMPNDPKFRTIARLSGSRTGDVISVFIHLMVSASANESERGRTQPNADDLASALDLETERVEAILGAMQGRVLDGEWLTGWKKRQPKREDESAERAHKWRENQKLAQFQADANARERTRTQMNSRRDGDETETRRDGEVFVVNDLLPAQKYLRRTDEAQKPPSNGHTNGNGHHKNASVRPSETLSPKRIEFVRASLHGYMRMDGTSFQRNFKAPDDSIVLRCINAIGKASDAELTAFLRELFIEREQSPRHATGPKKYAWFESVLSEKFHGGAK